VVYWPEYPALCFDIDEIRLEPTIERDASDHLPDGQPLGRVLAKLKAGKPITIVTMGDSLTDKHHWANRDVCWVDLLRQGLQAAYRSDVTIVNPAIGGTQLRQNVILIPRWLAAVPEPDLVTIFFGGNDWDSGMRGAEFRRACSDAVDRVRRATGEGRRAADHNQPLRGALGCNRRTGRGLPRRREGPPCRPGGYRSGVRRGREK